jgi:hypothetical protein
MGEVRARWLGTEPQHHWQPMRNSDGSQGVNGRVRSSLDAYCTMNRLDTAVDGRLSGINKSRFKRLEQ